MWLSVLQGEGEHMVMDLQDITSSLANGIFKSNIWLFDTSVTPLAVNQLDSEDQLSEDDMSDDSGLDTDVDSDIDEMESESSDNKAVQLWNTGHTSFWQPLCKISYILLLTDIYAQHIYLCLN